MSLYLDTHCHLDLFKNPRQILDETPNTIVVAVTELPSRYRLLDARFRHDRRVRVALGLHPLRAADAGRLEEGLLVRQLNQAEYIGEVGLDFSAHGRDTKVAQLRIFDRLLEEPSIKYKVISVHSRGAEAVTITRLRDADIKAILHWYTGPPGLVDGALAAGLYFSINPAMLRTKKGMALIAALPRDRVLTESDGPFAKVGGHEAGPSDMGLVGSYLARYWNCAEHEARGVIYDNLASLYAATVGMSSKS